MEEKFDTELPENCQTWVELLSRLKESQHFEKANQVLYKVVVHGRDTKEYTFKIDFIKARCFDEIIAGYPAASYFDDYYGSGGPSAMNAQEKLDKLVGYERPYSDY